MYTTATIFFKTLAEAGITHAFVNWGSDHPALLEDLERQRAERNGQALLEIVTCPNESVALSAAQGYAQVVGRPAAVIVHVDVGTQSLAGAVHNVDRGHAPVLIFAGASPFSSSGEHKGSRNEWPLYMQDPPDQAAIVRQYMRYAAQIQSAESTAKTILRALQFAMSGPQGPVYLWARREVLEVEVDASLVNTPLNKSLWPALRPGTLDPRVARTITEALMNARSPLIITANVGRNLRAVPLLASLSSVLAIPIYTSCPSALSVPYSHPYIFGASFSGQNPLLADADVVLILDADVPYVEAVCGPRADARVFFIDSDPLKHNSGWSLIAAEVLCKADTELALGQLIGATGTVEQAAGARLRKEERGRQLTARNAMWKEGLLAAEVTPTLSGRPSVPGILGALRNTVHAQTQSNGRRVLWINEGVSNAGLIWDHVQPEEPGSMVMSGGTSLGYALGAAVGAYKGGEVIQNCWDLIIAVVGDGSFLFGLPSTAYWMARRYKTPFLTVVLNNGGWNSPRQSMLAVHPNGLGSKVSPDRLTTSLGPHAPNYSQIAVAASDAWGRRIDSTNEIPRMLQEAIRVVLYEKRCAVVDCVLDSPTVLRSRL